MSTADWAHDLVVGAMSPRLNPEGGLLFHQRDASRIPSVIDVRDDRQPNRGWTRR